MKLCFIENIAERIITLRHRKLYFAQVIGKTVENIFLIYGLPAETNCLFLPDVHPFENIKDIILNI
jgi:hypothetical protein